MNYEGLYDISYRIVKRQPIIYLFRRSNNGDKVVETIRTFQPYFYINEELLNDIPSHLITTVENKIYKTIYGNQVRKCYVNKPSDIYRVKEYYENRGIDVINSLHESDILFDLRYAIDKVDEVKKTKYKVTTIDIETDCSQGFPVSENPVEPIICISVHDNYSNKIQTFAWHEKCLNNQVCDDVGIRYFNNEQDMLNEFLLYWYCLDSDIITGWNLQFDMKYLVARLKLLNIPIEKLSCIDDSEFDLITNPQTGEELNKSVMIRPKGEIEILGLVLFDCFKAYKKMHFGELTSYSLNSIANLELGEQKDKVYNTGETWRTNFPKLVEYNRKDVDLTVRIEQKCKLINIFDDIKIYAGVRNINDNFFASRIHETKMMKKYRDIYVFPNKKHFQEKTEDTMIKGAFVKEPTPGLYENVICLDAKSLYPSLIYTFNLSKEMISETEGSLINGIKIKQSPKGIMPSMIKDLVDLKDRMKKEVKGTGQDISDKMFAIKTFINSFYGVNALSSFRLYDKRIAENITYLGRQVTTTISKLVEDNFLCKVIYNDTDSIFVRLNKDKDLIEQGKRIQKFVNDKLPSIINQLGGDSKDSPMYIEFEKVYRRILFQAKQGQEESGAKKRYAGLIIWEDGEETNKLKIAGMQSRRSDVSELSKRMQKKVFEFILNGSSVDDVIIYLQSLIDDIKARRILIDDFALPVKLNKSVEDYPIQNTPKIRGVKWSNEKLGTQFRAGIKFKMIYVKHPETSVVCFEDEEQIKDYEIDWMLMFEKNIFQKIRLIFITMKWEQEYQNLVIYANNKLSGQTNIMSFSKNKDLNTNNDTIRLEPNDSAFNKIKGG